MKILKVTIQNLNSLRLKTTIDFTTPPLGNVGLFAITGDTGAGKTTLLDAITLALYGRVHRNKEVTEVMSYGSAESLAEVEFESEGNLYRSKWMLWRARRQPNGKMQQPEREVSKFNPITKEFEIIAQRIQEAQDAIEAATGLDFDRFTRSVLLSQGDFAAFLKAGERERSELLERITGTEIYSELSKAAFERWKMETETLHSLKRERDVLQLLDAESVENLNKNLQNNQAQAENLKTAIDILQIDLQKVRRKKQIELEIYNLEIELVSLFEQRTEFQKTHQQAVGDFQQIRSQWSQGQALFSQVSALDATIFEQTQSLQRQRQDFIELERKSDRCQSDFQNATFKIQQSETEIQTLGNWLEQHQSAEKLAEELPVIELKQQELQGFWKEKQQLAEAEKILNATNTHLQKQLLDWKQQLADLNFKLEELRQRFKQQAPENYVQNRTELLSLLNDDIERLNEQREQLDKLHRLTEDYYKLLNELSGCEEEREELQYQEFETNKELLTSMEALEQAEARRQFKLQIYEDQLLIANYEKDRSHLKEGDRCPLCFSTHHPFRHENLKPFVNFARQELDVAQKVFEELGKNHRKLLMRQSELSQHIDRLTGDELKPLSGEVEKLFQKILDSEEKIALIASDLHAEHFSMTHRNVLQRRLTEADEQLFTRRHIREQLAKLNRELEQLEEHFRSEENKGNYLQTEIVVIQEKLISNQERQQQTEEKFQSAIQSLNHLLTFYGFKFEVQTASVLFKTLKEQAVAFQTNQRKLDDCKRQLEFAKRDATNAQKQLQELQTQLQTQKSTLNEQQQIFDNQRLKRFELFGDKHPKTEQKTLQQQLEQVELVLQTARQQLETIIQKLEGTSQMLAARQNELAQIQMEETNEAILIQQIDAKNGQYRALLEQIGEIRRELKQHEQTAQAVQASTQQIEAQQREHLRWAKLKDIIGSADGKEFRVFAQGLTLRRLCQLANRYLQTLNGRYWIQKRDGKDLDLEIVDTYQADNRRSMNTLSGGESFLASLALALGLSDLAGQNAHIQSLFIDEGFGTLDDNSLDLAVNTLENLQASGKTIGIISHVKELKERITTQIQVKKKDNGFSEIRVIGG